MLQAEGELVACKFDVSNNKVWNDPQAMHCGLWRCSRRVLETIRPPWFQRVLAPDGTRQKRCVCLHFRDKARAAGPPYAAIIRRRCRCLDCGQVRIDKEYL